MNKICTNLEQSKRLQSLGIDIKTADMLYRYHDERWYCVPKDVPYPYSLKDMIPAWSLTALLGLMPDKISINNESYYPSFDKKTIAFRGPITWDSQKSKSFEMDNILDAAFEMVCWLKENNKL